MEIEERIPLLENILDKWKSEIGDDYPAYVNHVYRMAHFCFGLHNPNDEERKKIIIAGCFHDLGIWSDRTLDYIPPSIDRAEVYLEENNLEQWAAEIRLMIDMHHKVRKYKNDRYPLVEAFRRADLVDVSSGMLKFGLPKTYIEKVKEQFPNSGFHKKILGFCRHPLTLAKTIKL